MTELFQLPGQSSGNSGANPFARFGLEKNPFPTVGLDSGVLYTSHMPAEVAAVNKWITEASRASGGAGIRPLALYGSLGVGKTHLLQALERGLNSPATPVLRRVMTEEGMTRLQLANLILRHLPLGEREGDSTTVLLRRISVAANREKATRSAFHEALPSGSALHDVLDAVVRSQGDDDLLTWASRWLRREHTTPTQRAKLGLSGVLEGEGQSITVIADLLRLARVAGHIQVWFIMIDQLEELWREGVITPSRRARFLTDLRLLIDQALEGAPLAVLLAWNTQTAPHLVVGGTDDVARMIKFDYQALWQRLGDPVNLPLLKETDVWPFAELYLKDAGLKSKDELWTALAKRTKDVTSSLHAAPLAPRLVLGKWRAQADQLAGA